MIKIHNYVMFLQWKRIIRIYQIVFGRQLFGVIQVLFECDVRFSRRLPKIVKVVQFVNTAVANDRRQRISIVHL